MEHKDIVIDSAQAAADENANDDLSSLGSDDGGETSKFLADRKSK